MPNDNSIRQGTGTVRRYLANNDITLIGIERAVGAPHGKLVEPAEVKGVFYNGRTAFLTCEPELAAALLKRFGVKKDGFTDMESIIGRPCRYTESACGMLVSLEVLSN